MPASQDRSDSGQSLCGVSVLVTRPVDYDQYLLSQIESRGGRAVSLPALSVEPILNDTEFRAFLESTEVHKTAIFTSRSAVDTVHAWMTEKNLRWPSQFALAAVGPKTARAIQHRICDCDVVYPQEKFGVDGLMGMDDFQDLSRMPTTVIDGGGKNSARLIELLKNRGSPSVEHFVVYRRRFPESDTAVVSRYLVDGTFDFVVITSITGASNLLELLGEQLTNKLKTSCMVAYSKRIADYLTGRGFKSVAVASEASDDAVIHTMEEFVV